MKNSYVNNRPSVSIIVPTKNTARYLSALWDSIKRQSVQDFELIIVDNGSTDDTLKTAQRLFGDDKRSKIFELKRGGVSAARNFGLKKATANYVMFVDSDDMLQYDSIERLLEGIQEKDICIGKAVRQSGQKKIMHEESYLTSPTRYELMNAIINPNEYMLGRVHDLRTVWAKLYRKSFIENSKTKFDESIATFEDGLFNLKLIFHSAKVSMIDEYVYIYNIRNSSSIHKNQEKIMEQNEKKFEEVYNYAKCGLCSIDDVGHFSIELLVEVVRKSTLGYSSIIDFIGGSNISNFIRKTKLKLNIKDSIVKILLALGFKRTIYRCLS